MQSALLYARAMRMLRRDLASTAGRLFQTLYLSIIVGLFFFNVERDWSGVTNTSGAFFLITMNIMMSSSMPAVVMFPSERAVFLMEQANAVYNPIPYGVSKILAEVPVNAIFPVIFSLIVYWMIGLREGADHVFLFIFNAVLIGTVSYLFGFAASTVFSRAELALAFVPLVILPLGIVAGLFANTERLDPDWMWLSYLSFPRFSYIWFCDNDFRGRELCSTKGMPGSKCLYQDGNDFLRQQGFDNWRWTKSLWLYFCEIGGFSVIAVVALYIQGYMKRGKMSFKDVDPQAPEALAPNGSDTCGAAAASAPSGSEEKAQEPVVVVEDAPAF